MPSVRFVHAADLHLDTAFPGLAREVSPELARDLRDATFTALERLVSLCNEERPDFVIFSGDIYNQEDLSLRAQIAMRDACERLGRLGIPVFLAHGNHDPLSSRLSALHWPDNVTVFGTAVDTVPVYRPGYGDEVLAVVHGISHVGPRETRNLASWFHRSPHACPQIGVLHATLGSADGEARYAPCTVDDLTASGLDYWALGHIHEHSVVCREPLALYPGALQGLHIGEQGPHGCVLVTLESDDPAAEKAKKRAAPRPVVRASYEFRALAPVGWQVVNVDLEHPGAADSASPASGPGGGAEPPDDLGQVEQLIRARLDAALTSLWPGCRTLVVRICLTGRTRLDAELRRGSVRDELCETLQEGSADVRLWIKDIEVGTRPVFDREVAVQREDLLGEVLRRADAWRADSALLTDEAGAALRDLYSRGRSRRGLSEPRGEELVLLLDEAERLCADLLENN
ncbi:MAG: DNA repair exonuclease [Desulfovibrionaceae bacterium]|nr:DNA repair exonuclease [Desulfovibrionaceae bacterium]